MSNYRVFVEKYPEFQVEARSLKNELNENLQLSLQSLRLLNVYDLFDLPGTAWKKAGIPCSRDCNGQRYG